MAAPRLIERGLTRLRRLSTRRSSARQLRLGKPARNEAVRHSQTGHVKCEVEALRETVHVQRQIIDTMEKVNGPLMRWLKRAAEL